MKAAIYKYEIRALAAPGVLELGDRVVNLPVGAEVLSVANQRGCLMCWALVNPDSVLRQPVRFRIEGTGRSFGSRGLRFLGTVQLEGDLVAHVFVDQPGAGRRSLEDRLNALDDE